MRKVLPKILFFTACFMMIASFQAFAGSWQNDNSRWTYLNNDGTYVQNDWLYDNGEWYYFDSSGTMLSETLSPDGTALDSDGKRIRDVEAMPLYFSGTEADYLAYGWQYQEFLDGEYSNFSDDNDAVFSAVLDMNKGGSFENALASIDLLRAYDFTPYFYSENILTRKMAKATEIYRLEQICYMTELAKTFAAPDDNFLIGVLDKITYSDDRYFSTFSALSDQLVVWDPF